MTNKTPAANTNTVSASTAALAVPDFSACAHCGRRANDLVTFTSPLTDQKFAVCDKECQKAFWKVHKREQTGGSAPSSSTASGSGSASSSSTARRNMPAAGAREPLVPFDALLKDSLWEKEGIDLSSLKERYNSLGPDARKCVVEFIENDKEKNQKTGRSLDGDETKKKKEKDRVLKLFDMMDKRQAEAESGMCCVM